MSDKQIQKKANVPNLRFPGFSGEWEKKTLGEDCEINMCKRIFASQTSETGDVPFYKIGTIGGEADAYISQDLFEEYKSKYNFPEKGEVLISCAGTVGKTVIYDGRPAYFQDSNIVWISNPTKLYLNEFLQYVLSRVDWRKLNTTTIVRIYNDNLRALTINFPSIIEQRRIVGLLSKIDERIAIQNKVIEDLKKLKSSINDKLHEKYGHGIKVSFAEIGESYSGLSGKNSSDFGSGYHYIPYTNIFNNDIVDENDMGAVQIEAGEKQNRVSYGDVLFTLSSETPEEVGMGSVYLGHEPNLFLNSFSFGIHITRKDIIYPPYLSCLVSSTYFRKFIFPFAQGSTRFNLQKQDFEKEMFFVPDCDRQVQIASFLGTVTRKIEYESSILSGLISQKSWLLSRMFI